MLRRPIETTAFIGTYAICVQSPKTLIEPPRILSTHVELARRDLENRQEFNFSVTPLKRPAAILTGTIKFICIPREKRLTPEGPPSSLQSA